MAERRTIGNIVAPWRFLLFLLILGAATPLAVGRLHNNALGLMAGFDVAAVNRCFLEERLAEHLLQVRRDRGELHLIE